MQIMETQMISWSSLIKLFHNANITNTLKDQKEYSFDINLTDKYSKTSDTNLIFNESCNIAPIFNGSYQLSNLQWGTQDTCNTIGPKDGSKMTSAPSIAVEKVMVITTKL